MQKWTDINIRPIWAVNRFLRLNIFLLKPWNGSPSVYESQYCILIITNTTPPNFALKTEHTTSKCIRGRHIESRTYNSLWPRTDAIFTKISIYGTAEHTWLSPAAFGRFEQIRSRPLSDVVPTKGLSSKWTQQCFLSPLHYPYVLQFDITQVILCGPLKRQHTHNVQ